VQIDEIAHRRVSPEHSKEADPREYREANDEQEGERRPENVRRVGRQFEVESKAEGKEKREPDQRGMNSKRYPAPMS